MLGPRSSANNPQSPLETAHLWAANHPHLEPSTTYRYEELRDLEENGDKPCVSGVPAGCPALCRHSTGTAAAREVACLAEHTEEVVTGMHKLCQIQQKSVDRNINRVFKLLKYSTS